MVRTSISHCKIPGKTEGSMVGVRFLSLEYIKMQQVGGMEI